MNAPGTSRVSHRTVMPQCGANLPTAREPASPWGPDDAHAGRAKGQDCLTPIPPADNVRGPIRCPENTAYSVRTTGLDMFPRRLSLLFVLLACAPVMVASSGCQRIDARMKLKAGNQYYLNEDYKHALEEFQAGLKGDPSATFAWRSVGLSAVALYKPGVRTADNDRYAEIALDAFRKYLTTAPKDASKVREFMITTLISSERYEEALKELKDEAARNPSNGEINGAIVTTYAKSGRLKEAYDWAVRKPDAMTMYSIGVSAWDKAYRDPIMDATARGAIVDLGLQATKKAIDLKADYFEAMAYYNLLFREKAKLEVDEVKKAELIAQADIWRDRAKALIEAAKKREEAAAKAAAKS
jgi:tetratricopeptide (TPR) repeat protein